MTNGSRPEANVIIVGGGLAGLATAAFVARGGGSVTLLERSSTLGGRAITNRQGDFDFNLGPHALYRKGAAVRAFKELGIRWQGKSAPLYGYASRGGKLHKVSYSPIWFLASRMIGYGAKMESARLLTRIRMLDAHKYDHVSFGEWMDRNVRRDEVRMLVSALVRVATYANDTERLSAGLALGQLQMANHGVYYLDGGWQQLVGGLRDVAIAAGARIESNAHVTAVERESGAVRGVRLADGSRREASAVVICASPQVAASLVEDVATLHANSQAAAPVRAACLDVGLRKLPRPEVNFVLGLDTPTYCSVHSLTAKLAPEGQAMIHVAKYLPVGGRDDPKETERELESILDLAQPGWREELAERRFLPNLIVTNALATTEQGGLRGRPPVEVETGLYLAGDWVGEEGWLSDASLASAKCAAQAVSSYVAGKTAGREAVGVS